MESSVKIMEPSTLIHSVVFVKKASLEKDVKYGNGKTETTR